MIIFDGYQYRDYFWNDSDCNSDVAHYICVKVLTPPENTFLLKHIPPTNTCLKHIRLLLLQKNTFSLEFKLEHVVHYICLRTAQTAQIREQQQQLDFEEINLFSALFIVVCLSSEPFHISRPSANSLPCGPSTGGSRVQTLWKLRNTV